MDKIDTTCESTKLRLIANALGYQACTKTDGTEVLIPATDKRILIGNDAYLAKVALPAAGSASPAAATSEIQLPAGFVWPKCPPSKGQSHVLFEDGYAEGWAKAIDTVREVLAHAGVGAQPEAPIANANLLLLLTAASGYEARHEYGSITPEQWGDILRVCEGKLSSLAAPSSDDVRNAAWISVEDRLPAILEEVLIWCGYRICGYRSDDKNDPENHEGWVIDFDNGRARAITHWMPLPAAPAAAQSVGDADE